MKGWRGVIKGVGIRFPMLISVADERGPKKDRRRRPEELLDCRLTIRPSAQLT